MSDIKEIVRNAFKAHGLSQKEAAAQLGMTAPHISMMLSKTIPIPDTFLDRLFKGFVFTDEEKETIRHEAWLSRKEITFPRLMRDEVKLLLWQITENHKSIDDEVLLKISFLLGELDD